MGEARRKPRGQPRGPAWLRGKAGVWVATAVVGVGLVAWGVYDGVRGETREPVAVLDTPAGERILIRIQRSSDSSANRSSTTTWTHAAYDLRDGSKLGEVDLGERAKVLGAWQDAVWLDLQRDVALADLNTGEWLLDSTALAERHPQLSAPLTTCEPGALEFAGPFDPGDGSLCVIGNNGLWYRLSVAGELTPLPDDARRGPPRPCPPDEWWVRGSEDECLSKRPASEGGFVLASTAGWTSAAMLMPRLVRGPDGSIERRGPAGLLLVDHDDPGAGPELHLVSAIDPRGATAWTVSSRALAHAANDLTITATAEHLVLASSIDGGDAVRVSVVDLADGALLRSFEL